MITSYFSTLSQNRQVFYLNQTVPTDMSLRELTIHGSIQFPVQYYLDETRYFPKQTVNRHWHRELEFAVVREGEVEYWVGEEKVRLQRGEGIFINSRIIHGYSALQPAHVPNLVFSPELITSGNQLIYQKFIEPVLYSKIAFLHLSKESPWQHDILKSLKRAFELFDSGEITKELDLQIIVSYIWRELFIHKDACNMLSQSKNSHMIQTRLRMMLEFIYENYAEKIQLIDIASAANVSKSEALRCFKEGTSTSPIEYLNQYRLNTAKELLLNTDKTITEISSQVGYDNIGYFDRLFKRAFGVTPNQLRKNGYSGFGSGPL